jgi:hypothetical protein
MIQLVAQFAAMERVDLSASIRCAVAKYGVGFLQPRHGHFAYFSALVDTYKTFLRLWTGSTSSTDGENTRVKERIITSTIVSTSQLIRLSLRGIRRMKRAGMRAYCRQA